MRKYFLYELKKHLWTLVILTAVCALPYVVNMATFTMIHEWEHWETGELQKMVQSPDNTYAEKLARCEKEAEELRELIAMREDCA